jgi:hypothetical protein
VASPNVVRRPAPRVAFNWIIDRKADLLFYIGSALVGWLYVALILLAVSRLRNPLSDAFGVIRLGGLEIPLTLQLIVLASWGFIFDAPHLWSTLARTFFDPEERRVRRKELRLSWAWFFFGPVCILLPYLVNSLLGLVGFSLPAWAIQIGAVAFVVFFRIWAYYHVVRQHWGFFMLYKRKNGDMQPSGMKIETWFFNVSLYAPLVMFMTSPMYSQTPGMPPLGLDKLSFAWIIHLMAWAAFLGALLIYVVWQFKLYREGVPLNGPKILFLLAIIPLHLAAFNNPWLAALVTPVVTVGHNIQYHRIVWQYGKNKYVNGERAKLFPLLGRVFSQFWLYAAIGILFTVALYRGPWINWLEATLGIAMNRSVFLGIGMMSGLSDPTKMTMGQQIFGAIITGWAMQHYYLDAKIWRVGRDKAVAKQLNV